MLFRSKAAFQRELEAAAEKKESERARLDREWRELQRQREEEYRERVRIQEQIIREQIRQARELERHEAQLAAHEKRIADLEYRMTQAEADIEHWRGTVGALYALLDLAQSEQAAAVPGSKADARAQKQIISLNNQIHAAESKLSKAKHIKKTAERELSAA